MSSVKAVRDHQRWVPNPGTESGPVTCLFDDELHDHLVDFIEGSACVVGCVAWITDPAVLAALATTETSLVVQAERNLSASAKRSRVDVRAGLAKVTNTFAKGDFAAAVATSRRRWVGGIPGVNMVGSAARSGRTAFMHHKFLVRCERDDDGLHPLAVWTGSMNFSRAGSTLSLENAVIIDDSEIARAYLGEFESVLVVSRPWLP